MRESNNFLAAKKIIIGVTAGIACYKTLELIRLLRKTQAEVQVVMTKRASRMIHPRTFQAISGQPVRVSLWDAAAEAAMDHIALARQADYILIAPASADMIGRLAHGLADDLLTTLCLATTAPIAIAPSMNRVMWQNPAVVANVQLLQQRGYAIWGPSSGEQACGEVGLGCMLSPDHLVTHLERALAPKLFTGQHIVITAGSTQEALDPVRYITNHSTGKMAYALAEAALAYGAQVTLISGPTTIEPPLGAKVIPVTTALEMLQASLAQAQDCAIFIGAAAVCDYSFADVHPHKLKKAAATMTLTLQKTTDILTAISQQTACPYVVGFAAETTDLIPHARQKLHQKKLDLIVANWVNQPQQGFGYDTNAVTLLTEQTEQTLALDSKKNLGYEILKFISQRYCEKA